MMETAYEIKNQKQYQSLQIKKTWYMRKDKMDKAVKGSKIQRAT